MGRKRSFRGATVLITGAGGGIGTALARRFAENGARLALLDVDLGAAEALAAELRNAGAEAYATVCDVTDPAACKAAVATAVERWGGVDVLVNNAGITHRSPFVDTDLAVLRRVLEVNYFGALNCTKPALPSLIERQGIIVVMSSVAGIAPLDWRTGCSASKHALHGTFETLRSELRDTGVDVLMVCPSFIATGIRSSAMDNDGSKVGRAAATVGKVVTPELVADRIVRAAGRSRRLLLPTPTARTAHLLQRMAPRLYERLMSRSMRAEVEQP